jgi:ribosomal protein L16/L10AE
MGKGKGKLECWFTNISGGSIILEFRNLRKGRSFYFMKQMTHKLGVPTKFLYSTNFYFNFPLKKSQNIFFKTMW